MRQMSVLAAVGTMCIAAVSQLNAQIDVGTRRPDVIRGRVTTDSGVPVAGAEVIGAATTARAGSSVQICHDRRRWAVRNRME